MKKGVVFLLFSLILFFVGSTQVSAVQYNLYGKRMNGGIGNYGNNPRYYWISGGYATANDQKIITDAMYKWNYSNGTGAWTPIMFYRSYQQYGSVIDFTRTYGTPGIGATTYFYNWNNNGINPRVNNWDWVKIEATNTYNQLATYQKVGVMSHELGHAMGLNHNDTLGTKKTIMRTYYDNTTGPTINDFNGINRLY